MIIGVISDTHGLLRPEAVAALANSDFILHAGDIGDPAILRELEKIAPVTAVRGNVDRGAWARKPARQWLRSHPVIAPAESNRSSRGDNELAEAFCRAGNIASGRATIDQALERCHRNEELWYLPELLRIKGEILLRGRAADASVSAEKQFRQSLDWARRQEVLSWELRTATSLARLWQSQGRLVEARDVLASAYGRFSEGFGTADLRAAKHIVEELGQNAAGRQ